jgi:hypothetical protein
LIVKPENMGANHLAMTIIFLFICCQANKHF